MLAARRGPRPGRSGRWRRTALLTPLVAALALPLLAGPVSAAPGGKAPAKPAGKPVTTSYENPLAPVIPPALHDGRGGTIDSCADPMVIKGQDGEEQDGLQVWYLYCTTDPLNDEDVGPDGSDPGTDPDPEFHRIPMATSTDLVNWTYVGDAFPLDGGNTPAWIGPAAAFWAPDVVYSSTTDRYYLFVTVTDTTAAGGGSADPTCTGDSAIGVAIGESPTGPWTFTDAPVVAPRSNGPGCNYFWTYDPDVLGDTVGSASTLYYGSYYGGMFATPITFGPGELQLSAGTTADDTQIAIANRYEGSNVVFKDGFYYLFASATNCCNGALTGYSVFVGRSTSPYGPFVDREGNSFMQSNVGGTPFLTMNGNRWIGTGHNSVFEDEAGQWWTVYHAVDQEDPFYDFAPGFTKRPALLDPIDWIDGWPTVNGGAWASDSKQPAPAAQEGQRSRYQTKLVKPQVVHRVIDADDFNGTTIDGEWSWAEQAGTATVSGGFLRWRVEQTDLARDNTNNASVLVRDAPAGDYVVETRVRLLGLPYDGCCYNYAQAGLVIYDNDDEYVKLTNVSIWETRQTEFAKEIDDPIPGQSLYGNTVVGPPGGRAQDGWTWLRIVVERLSGAEQAEAGGDTERYTAYTSQDGRTWVRGGVWTHSLGTDAQIGLVSMGAERNVTLPITAEFDYVRVSSIKGGPRGS